MDEEYQKLIEDLIKEGYLKTPAIIQAFRAIDRKDFVLPEYAGEAYGNYPLPIGFGQTVSQPLTVAFMLELLVPHAGENVLDIGSGSGWQTALLAHVVSGRGNAHGRVTAIERIPELQMMTERNIEKHGFVKGGVVYAVLGDGSKGYAPDAPYDKIIAAAAGEDIPPAWREQLRAGGRIVAPIMDSVVAMDKTKKGDFKIREYHGFSFVPLVED
ncbi:MAG: protein-L-isoaspartate O-methyltransferase [Minisyncoccia bacterium]